MLANAGAWEVTMFKRIMLGLVSAALTLGLNGTAHATLINDTVACDVQPNGSFWSCSSPSALVGAGNEFQLLLQGTPLFDIDIGASSFSMTNLEGLFAGVGELLTISSLNWTDFPSGTITGITNFFTNANAGIEEADVTTGPNSVMIDFNQSSWSVGQSLSFDFVTTHDLPEPATMTLLGFGLAGLGLAARRRRATY